MATSHRRGLPDDPCVTGGGSGRSLRMGSGSAPRRTPRHLALEPRIAADQEGTAALGVAMTTADVLRHSVEHTHENLAAGWRGRGRWPTPGPSPQGRRGHRHVPRDRESASGAVDACCCRGAQGRPREPARTRVRARRAGLEVALAHVKAHAYGSTYESGDTWRRRGRRSTRASAGTGSARPRWPRPSARCSHPRPRRPGRGAAGSGGTPRPGRTRSPAYRCAQVGVTAGAARGGRVLGHRRGPDGPGAEQPAKPKPG